MQARTRRSAACCFEAAAIRSWRCCCVRSAAKRTTARMKSFQRPVSGFISAVAYQRGGDDRTISSSQQPPAGESADTSRISGRPAVRMRSTIQRPTRCARCRSIPATSATSIGGRKTLRSTGTFGVVFVDNVDIQANDALRLTTRSSFNIAWSPISRADLIAEFLFGRRENKDGQDGRAGQLQLGWIFRF